MSAELDALLDTTLDDIADLPEFKNFPPGSHHVKASFSAEVINEKPCFKLDFEYITPLELVDANDAAPKAGDKAGLMFTMTNEFGQGAFKKAAAPFVEALGIPNTNRAIIEAVQEVECYITTGVRKDKNDKTKEYMTLVEVAFG